MEDRSESGLPTNERPPMPSAKLPADAGPAPGEALRQAVLLQHAGRLAEARRVLEDVLGAEPGNADAAHLLGLIAFQEGDLERAAELMARSAAAAGPRADVSINLAHALARLGRLDEAAARLERAIAAQPANGALHQRLAAVHKERGRPAAAEASLRRAGELAPGDYSVHLDLGGLLSASGRWAEAVVCFRKAVQSSPKSTEAINQLGVALRAQGRYEEALDCFRRALRLEPQRPELLYNLGNTLADSHRSAEAVGVFRRLLALKPDHVPGHVHLAFALLVMGEFEEGWKEYEWRLRIEGFPGPSVDFDRPLWRGEPLAGRSILLVAEQGLGDALHFIRYAPLVAQRGGRVAVEVPAGLESLVARVSGVRRAVARGRPLPRFDFFQRLVSLPGVFGTTPATIPAGVPYLAADPARHEAWKRRFRGTPGPRVGVAWRGSPRHPDDRNRTCQLSLLAPLLDRPGVTFVSLQKDRRPADEPLPPGAIDAAPDLADFADTAAAVAALDLVVSVDTAVAHLAGGMGRPVWTLLPFAPDWRWALQRDDSPWYPTMRLFRQPAPGDWPAVVARVARALDGFAAGEGGRSAST
jgi:tetratricopeptide (TPR) repeat protein